MNHLQKVLNCDVKTNYHEGRRNKWPQNKSTIKLTSHLSTIINNMELKFKHQGTNYVVQGTMEGKIMKIRLATGEKKFKKTFTFEEFPD